jgi:hypothetical protein
MIIMAGFLDIKCLGKKEQAGLEETIERRIAEKIKSGIFTEREVREIELMRLRPIPDILDVQSVYEDFLFRNDR